MLCTVSLSEGVCFYNSEGHKSLQTTVKTCDEVLIFESHAENASKVDT